MTLDEEKKRCKKFKRAYLLLNPILRSLPPLQKLSLSPVHCVFFRILCMRVCVWEVESILYSPFYILLLSSKAHFFKFAPISAFFLCPVPSHILLMALL